MPEPTAAPSESDDAIELKAFIEAQNALGATLSTDLSDGSYLWGANGELTGLNLDNRNLQGAVSFTAFERLELE